MLQVVLALLLAGGAPTPAYETTEGVEIPAPVLPRLQALAEAFRAATGRGLTITDGTRRPAVQAALMLRNLERGDDLLRVYANRKAAQAVRAAWQAARKRKADRETTLARITEVIAAQVAVGDYVSKHLREGAVDVRCVDMSSADRTTFKKLARRMDIEVVDESDTATPHYHLNFVK
ncbi:MAG: hypothetical protein JNL82_06370 [Myxococcales bacterium]|nr:hypothetical protein [Myxococcales bacterium]